MNKSIILEGQTRKSWVALSIIFVFNSILLIIGGSDLQDLRIAFGLAMLIISAGYVAYAFMGYSVKSKYSAKIISTDDTLEIKTSFWKPAVKLKWADIEQIKLGNYELQFELVKGTKYINYRTTAARSIELKQFLRGTAEFKQIPVVGG
ncbi:hypothetical protein [Fulvivirga ligni]|uniref:hypothetical protein n=1 Tax=Fulvivirga ligni TaxID=2904246 RepID=UPI001F2C40A0|nr:hypothetical protein [Fulvivirga ligni]UII20290.1 hypothetical protein LVD16_20825 [Fulvivirga ligni]